MGGGGKRVFCASREVDGLQCKDKRGKEAERVRVRVRVRVKVKVKVKRKERKKERKKNKKRSGGNTKDKQII